MTAPKFNAHLKCRGFITKAPYTMLRPCESTPARSMPDETLLEGDAFIRLERGTKHKKRAISLARVSLEKR